MQSRSIIGIHHIVVASALILASAICHAQALPGFPSKALEITVPFPPGGGVDILARLVGLPLSAALGQPVVVENRPGASGTIAARYVAGRPADGHSLLMMNDAYAIAPAIYKNLPFDPKKDLAAVINFAYAPMLLVASVSSPYKSVADVVTAGKAPNSKLSYGSCGSGTDPHLAGELFNIAFTMQILHVPYKGCGPALVNILGGQIELAFVTASGALTYLKAGKMRALAITSRDRSKVLPDVPTLAESGAPGYHLSQWQGLAVPGGATESLKAAIYEAVTKVMKTETMQRKLFELGYTPADDPPEAFQKIVNSDIDRFDKLAKQIGLKLE